MLFAVAMLLGIIIAQRCDSYAWVLGSILLLFLCALFIYRRYRSLLFILLGFLLFYSIGGLRYLYAKDGVINRFLEYDSNPVEIYGVIKSYPDIKTARITCVVAIEEIRTNGKMRRMDGKVLLSMPKEEDIRLLDYGRRVKIRGELALPKGRRNPGGFDYQAYLAGNGVSATVFAMPSDVVIQKGQGANVLEASGLRIRNAVIDVINKTLPTQQAGLLNGMLIGYREGLDKNVQSAFSEAGITHIMAVSGANIAFIIFPLLFLFKKMRVGSRMSYLITLGVLVLFVYVTGFEPSVVRAVLMAGIVLLGKILLREADIFTSLSLAAILMLLHNPLLLSNIGFQLSFAATLSLVLFYPPIKEKIQHRCLPDFIADVLAATLAAQIGVLPISVYHFNQISIISILSNLLVVPLTQLITILGFAMAIIGQVSLGISQWIGYVNCSLLSFVLYVTKVSAEMPFSTVTVATPRLLLVFLYYAIVIFLLWYKPLYHPQISFEAYIYGAAILMAVFAVPYLIPRGLEVVFLDVGQGDSIFIRTAAGKTVLVDGGDYSSKTSKSSSMGDTVVIPFLLDYGVMKLDLVVATHGHDDHIQGLRPVLRNFPVSKLVLPKNPDYESEFRSLLDEGQKRRFDVVTCSRGDRIGLDKNTFLDVLHPKEGFIPQNTTLNNGSIVLKLDYKDTEILLTGDIEEEVEKLLLEDGIDVTSDFLKVAHHGSQTSSIQAFVGAVKAKACAISVGRNNFGHPSADVVERFENAGVNLFRTDRDGGIVVKSNGKTIKIQKSVTVKK